MINWQNFWFLSAFLSAIIAFIGYLNIEKLEGGLLFFHFGFLTFFALVMILAEMSILENI